MFNQYAFLRNAFVSTSCLALFALSMIGGALPAAAQGCQDALEDATEYTLTNSQTAAKTKTVDEWDDDVIRITTDRPGVILVTQTLGPAAQNSLYTEGSTGFHPLVDSAYQSPGLGELEVIVPAGEHCIQVAPTTSGSTNLRVEATFTDVCHLGETDDYNDSFLCAVPVAVDGSANSSISAASDYDVFTFSLTSGATITLESSGVAGTDVAGSLYDDDGVLLQSDDNGAGEPNFRIVRSLTPGRYYVRVEGVSDTGAYTLSVSD